MEPETDGIDENSCPPCTIADACATWILRNDNMDYIHTSDGKTCPDGTVLDYAENTSCN